ncbi:MAG: M4 family metallopeptidase [Saprospiraceae bacterium]|nr:M4 family metallopeptidase [Saprospiraceae bacterium]
MGHLSREIFAPKNLVVTQSQAEIQTINELESNGIKVFSKEKKQELALLLEDDMRELVWYAHEGQFKLAWHLTFHPNLASRWEYFIDANNGSVLEKHESLCKVHDLPPHFFDGKSVGTGIDLNGANQAVQTYQIGDIHTLIDASRTDMFDPKGAIPSNPIGTIITLDAVNTFPGGDDFSYKDLISNGTTWNNPDAVSAHINAATAYEYFRTTFNRISINGKGGNIISLINVADEDGERMDNAFWNGQAIFYGRGKQAFSSPLARGLDVAAHELGHGVIQTTANLEYQGESGALNESFADVFGVIVENEDWLIGEDIVNKDFFKKALRDMADPHNGGSSLNDNGWQPAHYDERYTGEEDNGGVHINSGIANKAFYLFATSENVGVEVAEQVYYNVLTNYLTRSSQFVDMRVAVIAAAKAMFNDQVAQRAASAFDQVGIIGDQTGNYTEDVEINPGQDFIVVTNVDDGLLHLVDAQGNDLINAPLSQVPPRNPPSITDDGGTIVYVAEDKTMHFIRFDWNAGTFTEGTLEPNKVWRNIAISKDGSKVAGILDMESDSIIVFSLELGNFRTYELFNPTTSDANINTGDVLFADALEWDHSGEFLMYDAFNSLKKFGSVEAISYWDIGFIRVWDEAVNNYGDGFITKLFSGLPEQISVGNPTFAKNSPYVIAFDYLDESISETAFSILGVNIETFDIGTIYENTTPGYPSFSRSDDQIIFNAEGQDQTTFFDVVGAIALAPDKINGHGDASVFLQDALWGEWFSNGDRQLVKILEGDHEDSELKLYPNPVEHTLHLEADWLQNPSDLAIELLGLDGKLLRRIEHPGGSKILDIKIDDLQPGLYFLKLRSKTVNRIYKVMKN